MNLSDNKDNKESKDKPETIEVVTTRVVVLASGDGRPIKEGVVLASDIPDPETGVTLRGVVVWIGRPENEQSPIAAPPGSIILERSTGLDYLVKGVQDYIVVEDFTTYYRVDPRDQTYSERFRSCELQGWWNTEEVAMTQGLREILPMWYWGYVGGEIGGKFGVRGFQALRYLAAYMDKVIPRGDVAFGMAPCGMEEVVAQPPPDCGDQPEGAGLGRYVVRIRREEHRTHDFEVLAASSENAEELARKAADDHDFLQNSVCFAEEDVISVTPVIRA